MVLLCRFLVCPKETKQANFCSLCLPAFYKEKTAHSFWKVLVFTQLKIQWFLKKDMTLPHFFITFVNSVTIFLACESITNRNDNNSLCLLSDNESSFQWCEREKNYEKALSQDTANLQGWWTFGERGARQNYENAFDYPQTPEHLKHTNVKKTNKQKTYKNKWSSAHLSPLPTERKNKRTNHTWWILFTSFCAPLTGDQTVQWWEWDEFQFYSLRHCRPTSTIPLKKKYKQWAIFILTSVGAAPCYLQVSPNNLLNPLYPDSTG